MQVQFFFLKNTTLTKRKSLKEFLVKVFKQEKKKLESLTYIFCSDDYLLDINRTNLNHNYYTDIITFNLSPEKGMIAGEIYISIDRVRENALTHESTLIEELHRVIFHGALHLCEYKDKTANEKKSMRLAEDRLLAKYFN